MALRSWLTILLGAIIAGLFAKFLGFVPGSKVFNIYTIVYGGSIIYAAWEDHRDDKQGTIFFMILGGVGILHGILAFSSFKLL